MDERFGSFTEMKKRFFLKNGKKEQKTKDFNERSLPCLDYKGLEKEKVLTC